MPRTPCHAVTWSHAEGWYDLSTQGHADGQVRLGEVEAWREWLGGVVSFAFRGQSGSLNVHHEARRGGHYWYAYHAAGGRSRKHYLGPTARVSLARLEEVAAALASDTDPALLSNAAPIPMSNAADLLPATKLAPPQTPPTLVDRESLLAALDAVRAAPLTLVAAPAGWGKTTLLAAWARRHPGRIAWLSLEPADDDPARFWAAVIVALRARVPGIGATALALLRSREIPPLPAVVTTLINELAGERPAAPLALVLDDYQVIAEPAIRESMAFLLAHLPAGLRLILASRVDPDLPLARLRARGQLAELRAAALRFSEADAAAFLRVALGAPLAAGEVAALTARTEGWAAGLQLAALALRGQDDPAAWLADFTGGHRYLLDYIEDEILARQPPAIRHFLLQAAILPHLGADLCAAVTGEAASGAILRELERQNLFLIPLDEEQRWYRLHDLFREALLARAQAEGPGLLPEAHRRAARWHAAHGDGRAAIDHALAAGDYPLAGDLIAREAPRLWLAGEARPVLTWLHALPDDALWHRAPLALDAALRLLELLHGVAWDTYGGARLLVDQVLTRIEDRLAAPETSPLAEPERAAIGRRLRLLRAMMAGRTLGRRGDEAGVARLVEEIAGLDAGEAVRYRMIALIARFWLAFSAGDTGGALLPELRAAKRDAIAEGEHLATFRLGTWLALIHTRLGQFDLAAREAEESLALAARRGLRTTMVGYLHNDMALRYAAQNRLAEAGDAARAALASGSTWHQADVLTAAHRCLAYLALVGGDPQAAGRELDLAEGVLRRDGTDRQRATVAALRARCWLAVGDLARAGALAEGVAPAPPGRLAERAETVHLRARLSLAGGRPAEALADLEHLALELERAGEYLAVTVSLALRIVALHQLGHRLQARVAAARLLALTEPNGALRPYLDEGAPMRRALTSLLAETAGESPNVPPPRASIARLLAAFDEERGGGRAATMTPPLAALSLHGPSAAAPLVEPLTRREREVLARLADGASNQEIADALALSVNTVKGHVGSLLGKLGATSRTGAVARAREAHLL